MSDLIVNHDGISAAATRLAGFRQTIGYDPFPPSIGGCGSGQVAGAFSQARAQVSRQDDTMRENWAAVGEQLRATLDTYTATDQQIATQGS